MIDILMPRLSDTMTEGAIAAWFKRPGDQVNAGDILVEIETDKATMEQESYETGVLHEIVVPEGEQASIGSVIARLDDGKSPSPTISSAATTSQGNAGSDPVAPSRTEEPAAATAPKRLFATPLVRKVAREKAINLEHITGSGPGGRIVRADLEDALSQLTPAVDASPADAEIPDSVPSEVSTPSGTVSSTDDRRTTAVPFTKTRQVISRRLTESSSGTPHFYMTAVADIEDLMGLRAELNAQLVPSGHAKITVNDLLVRASAIALQRHPEVNASYSPEGYGQTLLHQRINIGIAVAAEAGLVVPVITDANQKTASQIATESKDLVNRAQDRKLNAADLANGTFTISNLGMYGVEQFTAIINPPEGAILAVGAARPEPVAKDGAVTVRTRIRFTLSSDHRIIDGALAAQFVSTLMELLEHPLRIIA